MLILSTREGGRGGPRLDPGRTATLWRPSTRARSRPHVRATLRLPVKVARLFLLFIHRSKQRPGSAVRS